METYFKLKVISEYVIPVAIVLVIILIALFGFLKSWLKTKLMERLGYKYDRGLGTNVAYEFQSHWKKGNIKINYRKVDSLSYSQLKKYVKTMEEGK
jgi:hypothetical protein